ncbi:hypothetical protein [Dendronalium sp. ChiSLP03b]|uniref:hypothetical protein n=1 Tax=Dendronalium sp. ChiSLP03b TaxID=3075381 RepID=UPI00391C169F
MINNIAFETRSVTVLASLCTILKGGENEVVIREALQILRADKQLNQLETVLAFFATFVIESALVQEIMRWDMAVLRESPWYQEILCEGEARGRREELYSGIELALEIKFGTPGLELMPIIDQITDLQRLKEIQQAIKTLTTVEELQQVL